MNNKISIILFLVIGSFSTIWCQEKSFLGVFEDIELVDIQGTVHRPYDDLSVGKILIIDIFSTLCGPCWEYHQNNVLQDIYELYGPNGTNQIEILAIEGNINTNYDDLAGFGVNTFGDFIGCSPYPLIDDHYFPFNMEIHDFPTLLFICPDKQILEIPHLNETELVNLIEIGGCPDNKAHNNVDLLYFSCNLDPSCSTNDYAQTLVIQNNGENTVEHLSLAYSANGQVVSDSLGYDLFLEKFETIEIPLGVGTFYESVEMEVDIIEVNNTLDTFADFNNIQDIKPVIKTGTNSHTVEITTDVFGYEIYWEVVDENDVIVAWGGNELVVPGAQQDVYYLLSSSNYYESEVTIKEELYLNDYGCYTFRLYDDYGDGICCTYGAGSFEVRDKFDKKILTNNLFLEEYSVDFSFEFVSNTTSEEVQTSSFELFPNPCFVDNIQVEFYSDVAGSTDVLIYNVEGKLVSSVPFNFSKQQNSTSIDVSHLENGIYYLHTIVDQKAISKSFSVVQ